jgi:serine/threonine protein kinase
MNVEIPGYETMEVLGQGGMATVYLAKQISFDRVVALKVMAPQLSHDENFRERFLREAKIVANISHPNIVSVYDVGEHEGQYYLAMEYHSGGDLKSKIHGGIDPKECLYIVKDVCKALDYAHSKNIVHRDIKPDNVLFRFDGSAVLADFGIAKALESDNNLTHVGMVAGTPKYMSPEQSVGGDITNQSDLYSIGVVLYEMLTGSVPYTATDPIAIAVMHTKEPIPKLPPQSGFIQPLLEKLMAKEPAERFKTGKEVVVSLNQLIDNYNADKTVILSKPQTAAKSSPLNSVGSDETVLAPSAQQAVPKPKRTGLIVGGVAVCALLASIPFFIGGDDADLAVTQKTAEIEQSKEVTKTEPVSSLATEVKSVLAEEIAFDSILSAENKREINRLLVEFEDLLAKDRLKTPREHNALLVLQKILLLDPENEVVEENKLRIGERYLTLALFSARRGLFDTSRLQLTNAAEFLPQDKVSLTRKEVDALQKGAEGGQNKVLALRDKLRVQALLRQAKDDEENRRITKPAGNNAIEKYQEVLKIDPKNKDAKSALKRLKS